MMDCKMPEETTIRFYDENDKLSHILVEHVGLGDSYHWRSFDMPDLNLPSKKIINKDACVLFFGRKKVIVRRMEGDEPDPEKAFLQAYFLAASGLSRTKANKYLEKIRKDYDLSEKKINHIKVKKG